MINPSVYPQVNNLSAETRNFKKRQRGIWMLCEIPHGGVRLESQGTETSGSESGAVAYAALLQKALIKHRASLLEVVPPFNLGAAILQTVAYFLQCVTRHVRAAVAGTCFTR